MKNIKTYKDFQLNELTNSFAKNASNKILNQVNTLNKLDNKDIIE